MKHARKARMFNINASKAFGKHNVEKVASVNKKKITRQQEVINLKEKRRRFMLAISKSVKFVLSCCVLTLV
jgi:FKBP-type peptidyl-prolyl cis-trans isomerase 2